jgi:hypothetical protein
MVADVLMRRIRDNEMMELVVIRGEILRGYLQSLEQLSTCWTKPQLDVDEASVVL